uniref:Glyoxylate reductase/hydroxypyruvate reductase n=1 Tax=Culicoides sonorensis TaxID=179676 RepID=A0A336MIW7_CULSO
MATKISTSAKSYNYQNENWVPKVLITNKEIPPSGIDLLKQKCEVIFCDSVPPTRAEILNKSAGVDAILWASHAKLDAEALDAAGPQLKALSTMSAGIDYVDLAEVRRRNIPIGYTPGVLNNAVANMAIGLMIAASRRFHEGRLKIEQSKWDGGPQWMLGQDITDAVVGIVGFGQIGQTIAKRLQGFDIAGILYTARKEKPEANKKFNAKFASFDELIEKSDFVIICLPLTDETRGLFRTSVFKKMKSTSVLINVARGQIVNTTDLVNTLKDGDIFAAGLDVMDPEPLRHDHPLMNLPNAVIVPHLGSATIQTRSDMSLVAAHNILAGLAGENMFSPVP